MNAEPRAEESFLWWQDWGLIDYRPSEIITAEVTPATLESASQYLLEALSTLS